jgi:ADP-ribose pyrophosphatase YjhB (NUDIX family)
MRTNDRVTGIVIREAKLLLIHRFKQGAEYYVFPGGGVEEGETWEDALAREMQEETGLALVSYRYLYQSKDAQTQTIFMNAF